MIKVCFRKGGHPAYDEILNYPPDGVVYKEATLFRGAEGPRPPITHRAKRFALRIYRNFTGNINAIPLKCNEDIICSSGGLLIKSNKPWVTDAEHAYSLVGYQHHNLDIDKIKYKTVQHIKKSRCKILPWSYASLNSIKSFFGKQFEEIEDKFEVVYPAMHIENEKMERKHGDTINFLYVSRNILGKCGYEVLKAFDSISGKYDISLVFLSNTSPEIRKKFENNMKIKFIETPIPRKEVLELYKNADVFVLPTLFDTFGFVYLEAMSYGLPVIASNTFAVPEIIEDGKNGMVVDIEYNLYNNNGLYKFSSFESLYQYAQKNIQIKLITGLKEKMEYLIENDNERLNYGAYGRKLVENGEFSIDYRNTRLKKVFNELVTH